MTPTKLANGVKIGIWVIFFHMFVWIAFGINVVTLMFSNVEHALVVIVPQVDKLLKIMGKT